MAPHVYKSQYAKHAILYYKVAGIDDEWMVFDAPRRHLEGGGEIVTEIAFDGGIEICQRGAKGTDVADRVWTVRFEAGQYKDVVVEEYERTGPEKDMTYTAIQFQVQGKPKGFFKGARVTNKPKWAKMEDPKESETGSSSKAESSTAMEEDEDPASPTLKPAPDTPVLPLMRLSDCFEEDGYTHLLLCFLVQRRTWIWPAALTLLTGLKSWTTPNTKAQTDALKLLTLPQVASPIRARTYPGVKLIAASRGYLVLHVESIGDHTVLNVLDLPVGAKQLLDEDEDDIARRMEAQSQRLREGRIAKLKKDVERLGREKNEELERLERARAAAVARFDDEISKKREQLEELGESET